MAAITVIRFAKLTIRATSMAAADHARVSTARPRLVARWVRDETGHLTCIWEQSSDETDAAQTPHPYLH